MHRQMWLRYSCLLLLVSLFFPASQPNAKSSNLIVLADPQDDYYPLAEEIAGSEDSPIFTSWTEVLQADPEFVLWVGSPQYFSDTIMLEAGEALHGSTGAPLTGIITGSSLDGARALYQRSRETQNDVLHTANGEFLNAGITQARLIDRSGDEEISTLMTVSSLKEILPRTDYLDFTGHGSARYLRVDDQNTLRAEDVPAVSGLVISTGSCQTLRIWEEDSIAMAFINQGAAAYSGFVYSPMDGYMVGQYAGMPFQYTWAGFPIGRMAALINQSANQAYAALPFYFLIGDPRTALQDSPPYTVLSDTVNGNQRIIQYGDTPAGIIPVRVEDGASFSFVEIPGVSAATGGDPFFNTRLLTQTYGADRYLAFVHPGGPFEIRLSAKPPWYWKVLRPLADALDHILIFSPQGGGTLLVLILAGLCLIIAALRAWRIHRREGFALIVLGRKPLLCAVLVTAGIAAYQVLRLDDASITAKPLSIDPLWDAGVFLLALSGGLLYTCARRWPGRLFGILIANLPALLPGLFILGLFTIYNRMFYQRLGYAVYNLNLAVMPLLTAAVGIGVITILYSTVLSNIRKESN